MTLLIIEHCIFLVKAFLEKFLSNSETKYDNSNRLNNILRTAHEAKQSIILKARIQAGDEDAAKDADKFKEALDEILKVLFDLKN